MPDQLTCAKQIRVGGGLAMVPVKATQWPQRWSYQAYRWRIRQPLRGVLSTKFLPFLSLDEDCIYPSAASM